MEANGPLDVAAHLGAPVCPLCGCIDIYDLTTRRRFKCAACHRQFSVTSDPIFASRKLTFVDRLGAICLFVNAFKRLNEHLFRSLRRARDLIEAWRDDYNDHRPHSSLDWLTPREYSNRSQKDQNWNRLNP